MEKYCNRYYRYYYFFIMHFYHYYWMIRIICLRQCQCRLALSTSIYSAQLSGLCNHQVTSSSSSFNKQKQLAQEPQVLRGRLYYKDGFEEQKGKYQIWTS
jgi:hypothetical protein